MTDEIQPEKSPEITSQKETLPQPKKPAKKAPEKAPEITTKKAPETDLAAALKKAAEKAPEKEISDGCFGIDPFQKIFSIFDEVMKLNTSISAMQIDRAGCLVKTSNLSGDSLVETTTFVPGVRVQDILTNGKVVGRKLVHI